MVWSFLFPLAILVLGSQARSFKDDPHNEKSLIYIHTTLGHFCQLYGNHDAEKLSQLFTKNATFTRTGKPVDITIRGREAIRAFFEEAVFKAGDSMMYTQPKKLSLNEKDEQAVSDSTFYFEQSLRITGIVGKGSSHQRWEKEDNKWRIAEETVSVEEVYPKSSLSVSELSDYIRDHHSKLLGFLYPHNPRTPYSRQILEDSSASDDDDF